MNLRTRILAATSGTLFAAGLALAALGGQAIAWQGDEPSAVSTIVEDDGPRRLELDLPVTPVVTGTDAGLGPATIDGAQVTE